MKTQHNLKIPVFMLNVPLLDNEFDSVSEETFESIMAEAEFNDMEHKIAMLN